MHACFRGGSLPIRRGAGSRSRGGSGSRSRRESKQHPPRLRRPLPHGRARTAARATRSMVEGRPQYRHTHQASPAPPDRPAGRQANAREQRWPWYLWLWQLVLRWAHMRYYLPALAVEFCRAPTAPDVERRLKPGVHAGSKRTHSLWLDPRLGKPRCHPTGRTAASWARRPGRRVLDRRAKRHYGNIPTSARDDHAASGGWRRLAPRRPGGPFPLPCRSEWRATSMPSGRNRREPAAVQVVRWRTGHRPTRSSPRARGAATSERSSVSWSCTRPPPSGPHD